jgi:beta-lactamase superfamily II metal-dependent hydrolase
VKWMAAAALIALTASCGPLPDRDDLDQYLEPADWAPEGGKATGPARIIIVDVGQGDATLLVAPDGQAMLIDAGPEDSGQLAILPLIESEGIDELKYIVVTHYHDDHMGGVFEVVAGQDEILGTGDDLWPKGGIYDRGEPQGDIEGTLYPSYAAQAAGRRHTAHPGDRFRVGDIHVDVVAAGGALEDGTEIDLGDPPDENAASIALLIEYAGFKMFVGGDITGGGGTPPYNTPDIETPLAPIIGDIDILRVSHHGSKTSTNQEFLDHTAPEAAIISVGDGNNFSHPHPSVIDRLVDEGIEVYQTERGYLDREEPVVINGHILIEVEDDGGYDIRPWDE